MSANYQTPPTMNWNDAASQDLASAREGVTSATSANRVNQNNPFGSLNWSQDANGQWTQNVSLNPYQQQQMQNQQRGLASTSGQAANIMGGGVNLGNQMDTSGMKGLWNVGPQTWDSTKDIQNAMLSRTAPAMRQQNDAEQARLKAQGITEGSEAWNRAMTQQGQNTNDMQMQALLAGNQAANTQYTNNLSGAALNDQQRQQQFNEQQAGRNQQMNELAWMQGGAVQDPNFQSFYQQGNLPGSNYSGAMNEYYKQALTAASAANAEKSQNMQAGTNIGGQVVKGLFDNPGFNNWFSGLFGS